MRRFGSVWCRRVLLYTLQLRASPRHLVTRVLGLSADKPPPTAKQRYLVRRAIQFHGVRAVDRSPTSKRGGAIPTPNVHTIANTGSFSFDLVFALLPTLDGSNVPAGGILLAAQSEHATVGRHAYYHQQFVHIDQDGNLYCSVMREKPVVAERLEFKRWYHVVLSFESTSFMSATQRVYLNGDLVHTADGWLHDEWYHLTYAQLGTGCITGAFGPRWCGWYGFNGLVDECRIWNGALQPDEVRRLVNGDTTPMAATCSWSMRDVAKEKAIGVVSRARSTSPAESVVRHVKVTGALSRSEIPSQSRSIARRTS